MANRFKGVRAMTNDGKRMVKRTLPSYGHDTESGETGSTEATGGDQKLRYTETPKNPTATTESSNDRSCGRPSLPTADAHRHVSSAASTVVAAYQAQYINRRFSQLFATPRYGQ